MPFPDPRFMRAALALARKGAGRTAPNPAVGAVVVRRGAIVGRGFHRAAGMPHAEVEAIRDAGGAARGADLYVTLEPCDHHGRTGPCTGAIVAAGIRRVAAAMGDPDPRVAGRGFRVLAAAGIQVAEGLLGAEAAALNEGYVRRIETGRPFVTLKLALSLDGRIAAASRASRWITGERARRLVHRMRDRADAVLVGAGTLRADDPLLTARVRGGRDPIRVVVATRPAGLERSRILREGSGGVLVAVPEGFSPGTAARLGARGAKVLRLPAPRGRIAVPDLLAALGREGIASLLVEGGGAVAGAFVAAGAVDRYVFFFGPVLLGEGVTAVAGFRPPVPGEGRKLAFRSARRVGEDLVVVAEPAGP